MVKRKGQRQRSMQLVVVSIGTASEDVDHPAGASITYVSKHDRSARAGAALLSGGARETTTERALE